MKLIKTIQLTNSIFSITYLSDLSYLKYDQQQRTRAKFALFRLHSEVCFIELPTILKVNFLNLFLGDDRRTLRFFYTWRNRKNANFQFF